LQEYKLHVYTVGQLCLWDVSMEKLVAAEEAIKLAGGPTALAEKLGRDITAQRVNNWKSRGVPAEFAQDIELITNGEIPAHLLCPDVFKPAKAA
jgi:DNA-binding transcriptional regulator YdaS (Cro superfamily)